MLLGADNQCLHGDRGVAVCSNISGSAIITGVTINSVDNFSRVSDQRRQAMEGTQTNIAGNLNISGDFVGRDKIVKG